MNASGKVLRILLLMGLCCALSSGAWAASTPIKAGDQITLSVTDEEDLSHSYQVLENGTIELSGGYGSVVVAGKTPEAAQEEVKTALAKFIKSPDVRLEMLKAKGMKITVSGDVKSPGAYEPAGDTYLRDAIAMAGGSVPTADESLVTISRGSEVLKVNLNRIRADVEPDVKLQEGDLVNVPSRIVGSITILGSVKEVGVYPLLRGWRVLDVVRVAGGPQQDARIERVKIVREDATEETADLYKLLAGDVSQNKPILPGDTVVLESSQSGPASFSIMGAVIKPGVYQLTQRVTLAQALAVAGGFTPNAKQEECVLMRQDSSGKLASSTIDIKKAMASGGPELNIEVKDGDVLSVPDKKQRGGGFLETLGRLGPLIFLAL